MRNVHVIDVVKDVLSGIANWFNVGNATPSQSVDTIGRSGSVIIVLLAAATFGLCVLGLHH